MASRTTQIGNRTKIKTIRWKGVGMGGKFAQNRNSKKTYNFTGSNDFTVNCCLNLDLVSVLNTGK